MKKELLKLTKKIQKQQDGLKDLIDDLENDINTLWELVEKAYDISNFFTEGDDPGQILYEYTYGEISLKEADKRLKKIYELQNK